MIKYVKHSKKDYIVVDSTFQINEISCPIQVQVDISNLNQGERLTIFRATQVAFHRHIDVSKKKTSNEKKPWWKLF